MTFVRLVHVSDLAVRLCLGVSNLEHVNKRIECTRCVAADVVQTCVEGLGVRSLPLRHILGNLERLFEGGNISPAWLSVRHVVTSLALVVTILLPRVALASTLVGSYNIPTDADNVACDWFGYDYNTMDSGLKALLHSSTTTGGNGTDTNPNFAGYAAFRNSLFSPAVAGDYQWYSRYDGFMFVDAADKARSDIEGAIRWWDEYGNEQGGGSGGGNNSMYPIPSTVTLNGIVGCYTPNYPTLSYEDVQGVNLSYEFTNISDLNASMQSNNLQYYLCYVAYYGTTNGMVFVIYGSENPITLDYNVYTYDRFGDKNREAYKVTISSESNLYYKQIGLAIGQNSVNISSLSNQRTTIDEKYYYNNNTSSGRYHGIFSTYVTGGGGGSAGPTGGPVPPVTPTTPEVDEQPTYNNIYNINGSLNIDNSTTGNTEFELDLSELLDILKTINNNLVSFAEDFHNMWDWWAEEMGVIESDMRKFQDVITTWLQMIYNKISSGASSQPNPVTEPTSWWDWLLGLLNGVIGDLPTQLSAITTAASALRNVFPFSIPWDLGVLLGLFVASPVTPVIDIPLGISASRLTYVHVDCSSWNGVMQTVRSIELVAFAAGLAFKTRELLKVVEV